MLFWNRAAAQASVFLFLSLILLSPALKAENGSTNCYRFLNESSAEMEPSEPHQSAEVWCYQKLSQADGGTSIYIYNADNSEVRPELAILIDSEGVMTHASLVADVISLHKVRASEFNPFSIPLEEPRDLSPAQDVNIEDLKVSAERALEYLMTNSPNRVADLKLKVGKSKAAVPTQSRPWRGFWWPWKKLPMASGPNSPLGKYDRLVEAKTGTSPGSAEYEKVRHGRDDIWWLGHCNGWAASSILRKEPKFSRKDRETGLVFSIVDQKGILAEADYCSLNSFFGRRNYGGPNYDPKDIYPADFHKAVTYHIRELGKPMSMDYHSSDVVDNHIISGYEMNVKKLGAHTYDVTVRLRMHRYDKNRTQKPGVAPTYLRTYRYTLTEDENGNIVSGVWKSANPDYLWVPLSPRSCSKGNIRISEEWVQNILKLPRR